MERLLCNLTKDFAVRYNIRRAEIEEDHGWMDLELEGDASEIDRVVAYLRDRGVEVHPSNECK